MRDLDKAKELLNDGYTLALCRGDKVCTSRERGVKPLVQLIRAHETLEGASAADKIVGRAAAFLYVILGVSEVYAQVMSEGAEKLLRAHGIKCSCGCLAEKIINRAGTGLCPMENAVKAVTDNDPDRAFNEILDTMARLSENKSSGG